MPKQRFLLRFLLVALLCSAVAASLGMADNLFFDTVDVNLVNVEVVVTDKDGQPVTDLALDDFEILEDGQPVEITNFFPVVNRQSVIDEAKPLSMGDASASPSQPQTQRLHLVVFVDNINLDPRHRNVVFGKLRDFLREQFKPDDQIMLASLQDTVVIEQGFTNDIDLLNQTLDRLEKDLGQSHRLRIEMRQFMNELQRAELVNEGQQTGFNLGAGDSGHADFKATSYTAERLGQTAKNLAERRYQLVKATIDALGQFTDSLAGLPGRKAMLYVSDGLHVRPSDSLSQAFWNKYQDWIQANAGTREAQLVEEVGRGLETLRLDATRDFRELVEYASGNRVAFYPLSNLGSMANSHVSAAVMGSNSNTGQGPFSSTFTSLDTMSRESSLLQMADGTGGKAFTRTSNLGLLMETVQDDFENFYSLGYNSAYPTEDNSFRKITVKVKRPGVKVRHFNGHLAKDPLDHLEALTLSAVQHEMVDNPLGVSLVVAGGQVRVEGKKKRFQVPLTVQIPFEKLLLLPEEEFHTGRVSLFVVVLDEKNGGTSKPQHIELPIQVPNERIFDALTQAIGYPLTLELGEGKKRIAVGVRDNLARLDSTLKLEVEVGAES